MYPLLFRFHRTSPNSLLSYFIPFPLSFLLLFFRSFAIYIPINFLFSNYSFSPLFTSRFPQLPTSRSTLHSNPHFSSLTLSPLLLLCLSLFFILPSSLLSLSSLLPSFYTTLLPPLFLLSSLIVTPFFPVPIPNSYVFTFCSFMSFTLLPLHCPVSIPSLFSFL